MVTITEIIDLFETFWLVDRHLPSVKPKELKMGTMKWDYRREFSDMVHSKRWKEKPKYRHILLKEDIDAYNICTDLGLVLPLEDRKLLYMRPHCSYRKLAKMYGVSHEHIRNKYLSIVVDLVNAINKQAHGNIKKFLELQKVQK
tara:strand:- start:1746 stop:2177 length:432 start_codon:yes stop_codon:yes gene_type:complete